ncbi:MAG TPA: hypothetical protein VJ549_00585 [Geothrix sp.]|nr:hypothetical protein [Geothrix sp.]HJV47744.1 hypothetical protein [Geothrix sp.]
MRANEREHLLEELRALRVPKLPRPVPPVLDPRYQAWRRDFQRFVDTKDSLIRRIRSCGGEHATA